MKKHLLAATMLFAVLFLLPSGLNAQSQNPFPGYDRVSFIHNGIVCHEVVPLGHCIWDPDYEPWNGCFTPKKGYRVPHCTIQLSFPLTVTRQNGSVITITEAMVNAYWDNQFVYHNRYSSALNPLTLLVTRISGATWAYNCHGYSTNAGYWVQDPWPVWADSWLPCTDYLDVIPGCAGPEGELHSIKIECFMPTLGVFSTISEKDGHSGVYETHSFDLVNGLFQWPAQLLRPE